MSVPSSNWKELDEFSHLLRWVASAHRKERESLRVHDRSLFDAVANRFSEMQDSELGTSLPGAGNPEVDLVGKKRYVLLRQLEYKGIAIQPVLTLWSKLIGKDHYKLSVYVALGYFPPNAGPKPRYLGYRFESPEGSGGGKHDFFHAQHVCAFSREGSAEPLNEAPGELAWLPLDQPSFALSARCLPTFCVNILVTLYGGDIVREVAGEISQKRLTKFSDGTLCFPESIVGTPMMLAAAGTRKGRGKPAKE